MKLATVVVNGQERVAVAVDETTAALLAPGASVLGLIEQWTSGGQAAAEQAVADGERVAVAELQWRPPVPRPGKIICVALNNSANPDRIISGPKTPATFIKPSSSLIGSGEPIRLKSEYGRVHPEPELAVILGSGGADIEHADAMGHVFGYSIMNDLTSPTMRGEDTFQYRAIHPGADGEIKYIETWVSYPGRYKGSDTFGPMGPWVTTTDDIPDPHTLTVSCAHDGRVVTEDSTGNLLHSVADVISYVSKYMTLEAGDVISMGTALKATAGGGAIQNVDLTRLGGVIEVTIDGIGTLSNPVINK
jgi:2-keto-4-pentenoate hydratase/2-oxohepta-3-ene-1,7-dioic acid hydratase in catechol pathway